jgi:hypothetical protein
MILYRGASRRREFRMIVQIKIEYSYIYQVFLYISQVRDFVCDLNNVSVLFSAKL